MIKRKIPLLAALLVVLITSTAALSLAWFYGGFTTPLPFETQTGHGKAPHVQMFLYHTAEEGTVGWQSVGGIQPNPPDASAEPALPETTMPSGDDAALIPPIEDNNLTDQAFTYDLSALHFGKIDNLLDVKEDNIVYLKVTCSRAMHGKGRVSVQVAPHAAQFLEGVYDQKGVSVPNTPTYATEILNINNGQPAGTGQPPTPAVPAKPIFRYSIVVSDQNVTPGADNQAIEALFSQVSATASSDSASPAGAIADALPAGTGDTFYAYIRLSPNLDAFGEIATILADYMPCTVLFNLQLTINTGAEAPPPETTAPTTPPEPTPGI